MSKTVNSDDPSATYRGFRRQALYSLYRVFDDNLPDGHTVRPEGNEDVEILDENGRTYEVVQVKDFTSNLRVSTFKPSWFKRILPLCKKSDTSVKIVSFGPIGPEIEKAVKFAKQDSVDEIPERALETLTKDRTEERKRNGKTVTETIKGLSEEDAICVLKGLTLESANEIGISKAIEKKLQGTVTSGDPKSAFENLMWWILGSSEKQTKLTSSLVVSKLNEIGRFLSRRAAHQHEWHTTICPIEATEQDAFDQEQESQEFYQGGRVRFHHISLGVDIPRDELLTEIHSLFQEKNVVVVHAASGQGKTTLAYRYIHDFVPQSFRFEIHSASNIEHARRLVAAVSGHIDATNIPTLIYIDVRPGDLLWKEVVRELASSPKLKILVTIREEDWNRARINHGEFNFSQLQTAFSEPDAKAIFCKFSEEIQEQFLDFEDAWSRLGEKKTLFEFVFFVTQSEELGSRVRSQIQHLQELANKGDISSSELKLLRLVSIASEYDARIRLAPLSNVCEIAEISRTLQIFQNEYLVRLSDDGSFVEGFHAVRSKLINENLLDEEIDPWQDHVSNLLPIIDESDLEAFLLCAFSRRKESVDALLKSINALEMTTWQGVRNVSKSLMWLGVSKYVAENFHLVEEAIGKCNKGWQVLLDWDIAKVNGDKGLVDFDELNIGAFKEAAEASKQFRQRQSSKDDVFENHNSWIKDVSLNAAPTTIQEFVAFSEVVFWCGHLGLGAPITSWVNEGTIDAAFELLTPDLFGKFALSIQSVDRSVYQSWLSTHSDRLEEEIRRYGSIMAIENDEQGRTAHYAIDLDRNASSLRRNSDEAPEGEVSVNDLSVERVLLLRNCLPDKAFYGAQGYGHTLALIPAHDDSTKRMPIENIELPWLPQFNGVARGLVEYRQRPDTWIDYFQLVNEFRECVLDSLTQVLASAKTARVTGKSDLGDTNAWNQQQKVIDGNMLLPKVAVDEWGFISESNGVNPKSTKHLRELSAGKLKQIRDNAGKMKASFSNFMQGALEALLLIPALSKAPVSNRQAVIAVAAENGVHENSIRTSLINLVDACNAAKVLWPQLVELTKDSPFQFRGSGSDFRVLDQAIDTWASFTLPKQRPVEKKKNGSKKRKGKRKPLKHLSKSLNRVKDEFRKLQRAGIDVKILSEDVMWEDCSSLWVTCDSNHPIQSLIDLQSIWSSLIDAFRPDVQNVGRTQLINYYWTKIVVVPLVCGKSIERHAMPHFSAVRYHSPPDLQKCPFYLSPQPIAEDTWHKLGISSWEAEESWRVFDEFAGHYNLTFQHVNHIADFERCDVEWDDLGEEILQKYVDHEAARANPIFQNALDSFAHLLKSMPDMSEDRPNLIECSECLVEVGESILPAHDYVNEATLSVGQIVDWRNRLQSGLELLGLARCYWIADSLNLGIFDPEN